ncbi:MAG: GNAT family N-acetyltransferase [Planctomycetes bacterium]|nr:GNAT family N-acetyltransferase [Planctomycetota bacterium]
MTEIDLQEYQYDVRTRQLTMADYERVVELQTACFPGMLPWSREQFESQQRIFPEGQLGVEVDGRLVASSSSLIIDYDLYSNWHDWKSVSDSGFIRNHDANGDMLYGIEIMVDPEFRGMKLARRLYEARKNLVRERNLKGIVIGGRIPGYMGHRDEMSAHEYVEQVEHKTLYDPVLTTQLANGFELKMLTPDYLPSDEDSGGWATHMEWTNIDYRPFKKRSIQPVQTVRLAAVQYMMREIASIEEFERQCSYFVDTASDYRCDFVVFPELFTIQLLSFLKTKRPAEAARKLSDFTPRYLEFFTELAIRYHINIIGGSNFAVEDGLLYNVAYLFRRDGSIEKQYKIHITPAEWKWWGVTGGDRINVFDTDCGKVAILICYDIEFPEIARIAVRKGAQIIFCPFNTDVRLGYLRVRHCAQARCIENHVYVVVAGCTGNLPQVPNADIHYAQSGIFTPADISFHRDGVAAECTPNIETIIMQDLDIELLRRHRYRGSTTNWLDRRRDLYSVTYREDDQDKKI